MAYSQGYSGGSVGPGLKVRRKLEGVGGEGSGKGKGRGIGNGDGNGEGNREGQRVEGN